MKIHKNRIKKIVALIQCRRHCYETELPFDLTNWYCVNCSGCGSYQENPVLVGFKVEYDDNSIIQLFKPFRITPFGKILNWRNEFVESSELQLNAL